MQKVGEKKITEDSEVNRTIIFPTYTDSNPFKLIAIIPLKNQFFTTWKTVSLAAFSHTAQTWHVFIHEIKKKTQKTVYMEKTEMYSSLHYLGC